MGSRQVIMALMSVGYRRATYASTKGSDIVKWS